ncbi:MAG: oligosaccharide flippase family protein [Patescibacteria group bacterium]
MKKKLFFVIEKIHQKIFGHEMSKEMKNFLHGLSWSVVSGIIIMPIILLVNTLAGRLMGPTEYGKYNLLLIINQFLIIFIFFGLDTTIVKYISKATSFKSKKMIISTISIFNIIILLVVMFFISLIYLYQINLPNNYSLFMIILGIYTFSISIKSLFDLINRGLENFRRQSLAKIVETIVVLLSFLLLFVFLKKPSYINLIFIFCLGAFAASFYNFSYLFKYFGKGNNKILISQLHEGKFFFISSLLMIMYLSADKLIIGKYLGIKTLGIYSAYYFASFNFFSLIIALITNVFFPISARLKNKGFTKKIDRLMVFGFVPLILFSSIATLILLKIFGREYPINILYIIGFSIYCSLFFFLSLYNTVILDVSKNQYKKYLLITAVINFFTISIYVIIGHLHVISISLILFILIINSIITILVQKKLFINKI